MTSTYWRFSHIASMVRKLRLLKAVLQIGSKSETLKVLGKSPQIYLKEKRRVVKTFTTRLLLRCGCWLLQLCRCKNVLEIRPNKYWLASILSCRYQSVIHCCLYFFRLRLHLHRRLQKKLWCFSDWWRDERKRDSSAFTALSTALENFETRWFVKEPAYFGTFLTEKFTIFINHIIHLRNYLNKFNHCIHECNKHVLHRAYLVTFI